METLEVVFLCYSLFIVTASFINLLRIDYWWIRMWDFPHLQLIVLAVLGLGGWFIWVHQYNWPNWLVPVFLVASIIYQLWLIFPYTRLHAVQVPPLRTVNEEAEGGKLAEISLLIANILMENNRYNEVLQLAQRQNPDIILILEADETWRQKLNALEPNYPYRLLHPLDNTYGMLLYSRVPVRDPKIRFLIEDEVPSIHAQLVLENGQNIHFFGVHPEPPSPTEHNRSTERDAELVLVGREARRLNEPVIVAGDLNDVAWSHTTRLFQRISGLLDPRVGRGLFNTFHAHYFFMRWPLDHIFVSQHFRLVHIERMPSCGSDHFPMFVTLQLDNSLSNRTNLPKPDKEDKEEAAEKVDEAKENK
ncbi:endonuclease/exonuclease/phosphatase family protein [Nibrella saemangeumensis]|uniref:Endonuclease/exonuclease/phosphatase family protein n=1 Tax=Nibrella saemangeumensis TaxID=1084526 RepID=A0ABP8NJN9_9BACT